MALWLVPLLLTLDQILKLLAERHLSPIPHHLFAFVYLTLVENSGAAFGLFPGSSLLLAWLSLAVGIACLYYLSRRPPRLQEFALSLVASGALGNAIDRLGRGRVIDYIDLGPGRFPVFNLADACVVVGVLLLILFRR
jgi:signal peptidase II